MIISYITCKNKKEAEKISYTLLNRRLAACCNLIQARSLYLWQNKLNKDNEVIILAKTLDKKFNKIKKEVLKIHSYKVPCILKIKIEETNDKFLKWLKSEIR